MAFSKYDEDKRKEELFGKWLDGHFYKKHAGKYKSITRCYDEAMQKKGVDVTLETLDGEKVYVDEKAALHYINQNIPTFAFEIKNGTSGKQGWLFDPDYLTHYYLLAWPNATDDTIPDEKAFTETDVMFIKRDSVIKLLSDKGLTESDIKKLIADKARFVSPEQHKFDIAEKIQLNFNTFLAERPINLVIRRELLKEYAEFSEAVG